MTVDEFRHAALKREGIPKMQPVVYRKLSELVSRFDTTQVAKPIVWAKRLFESLDWGSKTFSMRPDGDQRFHLLIDNAPVVNVLAESPDNVDAVYRGLNRAYNQDVPWVVATDFYRLGIYGSYWYSFRHDVSSALALQVDYTDYLAESHQLELLTPSEVARNTLNDLYTSFRGRKRRLPIDIHLVERMGQWRELLLATLGDHAVEADQLIHRLINTLFLIRYFEDTGKADDRQPLRAISAEASDTVLERELWAAFKDTKEQTGYLVPSRQELKSLAGAPLRRLIDQLYGYPDYGIEYDFAAMTVDVLGRFYEEYLRKEVVSVREERRAAVSLFEPPTYEINDVRRQRGVFYTPRYIVDYILNSLIERFQANHPSSNNLPYIADIAAGSGTFLAGAMDRLLKTYPKLSSTPDELARYLIGFDIDPRATEAARLNLIAKLIGYGAPAPLPALKLHQVDLLFAGTSAKEITDVIPEGGADIIVSNPPYIRYELLKNKYDMVDISGNFEMARGRTDSYVLFLEAAVRLLKNGGFGGLVLPNTMLRSQSAGPVRQWLAKRADILEIIDFADQPVFQSIGTYTCLLLFRKHSGKDNAKPQVTVGKVYKLSETPASQLASISVAANEAITGCDVFRIDQPSGRAPWVLRNRDENETLRALRDKSDQTVADVLSLRQGIKTGADPIFIINAYSADGRSSIFNSDGVPRSIESELLIPVLRNRDLRRWGARASEVLIYPYDRQRQKPMSWKSLQTAYPQAAAYLLSKRRLLEKRGSLRKRPWFELSEPRIQSVFSPEPSLLISELSLRPTICRPSPSDAAVVGSAWLSLMDPTFDVDVLMSYLNSTVAEWYLRQVSTLLQGGYILIRQNNLLRLPLPRFLKEKQGFVHGELARLGRHLSGIVLGSTRSISDPMIRNEIQKTEEQIDVLIMQALGLTDSQAEQLRKSVALGRGGSTIVD